MGLHRPALRGPRQDLTMIEAPLSPSDAPPGMLPLAGEDAFPPSAPHSVPAYARIRWLAAVVRWWRAASPRGT
jgi:hypothetical protein